MEGYDFYGFSSTSGNGPLFDAAGFSIMESTFHNMVVMDSTGTISGLFTAIDCYLHLGGVTVDSVYAVNCRFASGIITVSAGELFYATGCLLGDTTTITPVAVSAALSTVKIMDCHGRMILQDVNDGLDAALRAIELYGTLELAASCVAGTITLYGRHVLTNGSALTVVDRREDAVPTADAVTDILTKDVIGRKTDTARVDVAATRSLVSYAKGALTMPVIKTDMSCTPSPRAGQVSSEVARLTLHNLRISGAVIPATDYAGTTITINRFRPGVDAGWVAIVAAAAMTEAAGYAYYPYTFPAASWQDGDRIQYVIQSCVVTIGAQVIYIPAMTCYGVVGGTSYLVEGVHDIQDFANAQFILHEVFFSGTTTKAATVTAATLDAVGGVMYDIKVKLFGDDDAAATFTFEWAATRPGDLVTFVTRVSPAATVIATPAADYEMNEVYGDLAEDLQLQFNITQDNAGDATNAYDGVITYWSRV
jgi:hypothetical protein